MKPSFRPLACLIGAASLPPPPPCPAQPCTLSWNDPVGGLFTEAGRWSGNRPDCQGRAPRDGDSVAFRPGAYTVGIPGSTRLVVTEFDVGTTPADITFEITGAHLTRVLATSGTLTLSGPGRFEVSELCNLSGDARLVFDGLEASLGSISAAAPGPPDLSRQFLVRNQATLTTLSGRVPGTTVDAATWKHLGPADGVSDITVVGGGRFEAPALNLRNARLTAAGGSVVEVAVLASENLVDLASGSRMNNRTATLGAADAVVSGPGSRWTLSEALLVTASAQIASSNRAELVAREVRFSDPSGFALLSARGTDARVVIQTPLTLLEGNVDSRDGGQVTVPALAVGGARTVTVGSGPLGLGGARFDCEGSLVIGTNGVGTFTVSGGGRASAARVEIGSPASASGLTVDATTGTARFEVHEQLVVGGPGRGTVRIRNGGHLAFTQPGGSVLVAPGAGDDGDLTVDGLGSTLDLGLGSVHVGREGAGRMTVSGGGTLRAASLNLGDTTGTPARLILVTGPGSTLRVDLGAAYVANATLRVANQGFLQVRSDTLEGSLALEAQAVVDVTSGSLEVGNGGGAPVGTLRVDRGRLHGGGIIRAGSVEVVAEGRLRPGSLLEGSHVLRIQGGHYLQDAGGTMEIEVFGDAAAPRNLVLEVDRGVRLDGTLVVHFLGAAPKAGDRIGFLRFGESLLGGFANVVLQGLAPGVGFRQGVLAPGIYGLEFTGDAQEVPCAAPPPEILSLDVSQPGLATLAISAGPCGILRLQASSDLASWTELQAFAGSAAGPVSVTVPRPAGWNRRYYRVVRW